MDPDRSELDAHRPLLLGHCYRMLGHPQDAADAVQDTYVRAMRGLSGFRGEASLGSWLVRIATNVCLDELSRRKRRRERPTESPPGSLDDPIVLRPAEEWLGPVPDEWLAAPSQDAAGRTPFDRLALRQSVRLAFVAALQHLPPKQRAALLLTQVLGWSAAEAAAALETTVPSVNSALQRARAKLDELEVDADESFDEAVAADLLERYTAAFERFDLDGLAALLTEDVRFSMPPITLWVQGPAQVAAFLRGPGGDCRGSVVVPTRANGLPAFAQYRFGGSTPWGVVVLEPRGDRIAGITTFLEVDVLFPLFGLPEKFGPDR